MRAPERDSARRSAPLGSPGRPSARDGRSRSRELPPKGNAVKDGPSLGRVCPHELPFLVAEGPPLVEHLVRHLQLADVVEDKAVLELGVVCVLWLSKISVSSTHRATTASGVGAEVVYGSPGTDEPITEVRVSDHGRDVGPCRWPRATRRSGPSRTRKRHRLPLPTSSPGRQGPQRSPQWAD